MLQGSMYTSLYLFAKSGSWIKIDLKVICSCPWYMVELGLSGLNVDLIFINSEII